MRSGPLAALARNLTDGVAMLSGAVAAFCVGAMGWPYAGYGAVAWAGLGGLLVAHLTGRHHPGG
ncbi:hypothetical protein GCM10010272_71470 [Streptomyces lateritius]|nr:hypothetical protein GCM10010272_71470 [Streptomyces lateritius]